MWPLLRAEVSSFWLWPLCNGGNKAEGLLVTQSLLLSEDHRRTFSGPATRILLIITCFSLAVPVYCATEHISPFHQLPGNVKRNVFQPRLWLVLSIAIPLLVASGCSLSLCCIFKKNITDMILLYCLHLCRLLLVLSGTRHT